jgi:hypothetical protein
MPAMATKKTSKAAKRTATKKATKKATKRPIKKAKPTKQAAKRPASKKSSTRPTGKTTTRTKKKGGLKQYPPGLYDVLRGDDDARIARILSLSKTLPTAPGVTWIAHKEHWFTTAGLNLQTAFGVSTLKVRYVSNLTNLNQIAAELANTALYTFQLHAKGILTQADWIPGAPPYLTPAYYWVQNAPPIPNRAMRPLFEVATSPPTKLNHVAWVTLDNTVTNYFSGATPGTTILLNSTALAQIPSNGWYYRT